MAEWPKIVDWYDHANHETVAAKVVPADLAQELYEALKDGSDGMGFNAKRVEAALRRYEEEVDDG